MNEIAYNIKASTFSVDGKEFAVEGNSIGSRFVEIDVSLQDDHPRLSEALAQGEEIDIIFSTTTKIGRIIKLYNDKRPTGFVTRVEIHIPEPINFNQQ